MTAIQEQVNDARELLERAEKTFDPTAKRALVESALEIFDDCMDSEPTELEITTIKNVRKAYARTLVDQIPKMNLEDENTLLFFVDVLLVKFYNETMELTDSDADFKRKMLWVVDQYKGELTQVFSSK